MTQIKLSSVTVNVHSTVPAVTVAHLEFFFFVNICFHFWGCGSPHFFTPRQPVLGSWLGKLGFREVSFCV